MTSSYSGVAFKHVTTPVGLLGPYLLPLAGVGTSKYTVPSLCFIAVPVLGDCHIHDSKLDSSRLWAPIIVSERRTFHFFHVILVEMFV